MENNFLSKTTLNLNSPMLSINSANPTFNENADKAKMEEAAEQFEAVFLQQMINSMWNSVPNEGLLSGGNEEAFYRDMFNQALSEEIASSQSMGLKDMILKEMQK